MPAVLSRAAVAIVSLFRRHPWIGWAGWAIFVAATLLRVHPRRFGTAFGAYLEAAQRLWNQQAVYDPQTLGDFLYFPVALLVLGPLTSLTPAAAALIVTAIYALVFSWAAIAVMQRLIDRAPRREALLAAGVLLLISIPAAWWNFKYVQSQAIMSAGMMAAAACLMRERWLGASGWLLLAVAMKPLAVVMLLLCAVLVPRTRLPLLAGLILLAAAPFAFLPPGYMLDQYQAYALKMWHIATVPPQQWIYQADFTTLLKALGVSLPGPVSVAIRGAAALLTLGIAWRLRRTASPKAFGLGVWLLAACYINLFTPRNEHISFLVLAPALAALATLLLLRSHADPRGWLLVAASLLLGYWWSLHVDAVLKPAVVLGLLVWLGQAMLRPRAWAALIDGTPVGTPVGTGAALGLPATPPAGPAAATPAVRAR